MKQDETSRKKESCPFLSFRKNAVPLQFGQRRLSASVLRMDGAEMWPEWLLPLSRTSRCHVREHLSWKVPWRCQTWLDCHRCLPSQLPQTPQNISKPLRPVALRTSLGVQKHHVAFRRPASPQSQPPTAATGSLNRRPKRGGKAHRLVSQ